MTDALLLMQELSFLRRGYGLHSPDLMARVGPALASTCGIDDMMSPAAARARLLERISGALTTLPPDLRLAVQAAFSLEPASQSRFLRQRMEWLGSQLERDPRTAVRRVEVGLQLLAEELIRRSSSETDATASVTSVPEVGQVVREDGDALVRDDYAPIGWYVHEMTASLLLHLDPVRLLETRRVVSTQDGLDALRVSWSIPSEGPAENDGEATVVVEIVYGGELLKDEAKSTRTYWTGWIVPPRPLNAGDRHEYQVHVRAVPRALLRPYYVLSPHRRVDFFELRAKFPLDAVPGQIWAVDGVPFRLVDERHRTGEDLRPNGVGEIVSRFRRLRAGLSYGLAWK